MDYRIGLDIGITSVGWAVLENGLDDEPKKLVKAGVRIFDKAENPKDGASLALPRREARGTRRRLRRRRHRMERIRTLFEQALIKKSAYLFQKAFDVFYMWEMLGTRDNSRLNCWIGLAIIIYNNFSIWFILTFYDINTVI